MTEQEIMELFEKRDEKAIYAVSQKYGAYCNAVVNRILADKEDVEECLNDTWLAVWKAIPPAKPLSLKAYMAKTARNKAINRIKSENGRKKIAKELQTPLEELNDFADEKQSVEGEILKKELTGKIDQFLKRQNATDRNMFLWRYFYLDSIPEIAKRLGMKENTVKTRLARMRTKLAKELTINR